MPATRRALGCGARRGRLALPRRPGRPAKRRRLNVIPDHSSYVTICSATSWAGLRRLIGTYAGQALAPACQLRHVADPPDTLFREEPVADVQRTRATDDTHLLKLESDDEKVIGDRFERDLVSDRVTEPGQLVVQSACSKEVVQSPKDSPTLSTVELDRPVTRRCLEETSRADGIEVCAFASRQAQFFRELRDRLRRQGNFDIGSQDAYGQLETSLDRPQEK
jgi:hypothetical protein